MGEGRGLTMAGRRQAACTGLLHIDHMNDYSSYIKLLLQWAQQLQVKGCILFPENSKPRPRNIFVVMDGAQGSINEFLRRLRTENVDVTIKGHPCKERQSTLVSEIEIDPNQQPSSGDLQLVQLSGTRNPLAHLPEASSWLLRNRSQDGPVLIELMNLHLQSRKDAKKAQKAKRANLASAVC